MWISILALTSAFQFGRGAILEGVVFAVSAGLAIFTLMFPNLTRAFRNMRMPPPWIILGVAIVTCTLLILLPSHSPGMTVVLAIICGGVLMMCWGNTTQTRGSEHTQSRQLMRSRIAWAILALLVCIWELISFTLGAATPSAHPTITSLVEPVLATEPGRSILIVVWVFGGVLLLRRGRQS